ncbi:MAG: PQQ-binding-like beta-propeller repeat protein [Pirellulaceae bacterium]|jgi:outer membrane protein assembly factor BamB|nr:PQQ-binding-like beta-propeller repeat protein [Pirellulaceae bacterium]
MNNRAARWASAVTVVVSLAAAYPAGTRGENWARWRGPSGNAVSGESQLPVKWSSDEAVRWRVELPGAGISSPIIWEDQVIITSSDGVKQDELHVISLDRKTGKRQWRQRLWGTAPTRYHATKSSMASPTPVTDGKQILAFFGTGDLFCLDMSGRLLWQRSLASEYGVFENRFSATSSPVLHKGLVILQCDHHGDSYALAIDQRTGANRWRVERPNEWLSWSSPQLVPVGGGHELLLCGSLKIDALEPETGKPLWTIRGMQNECIPTPLVAHGLIYAVSGPGGKTMAIRPGGRGDITDSHVVWENTRGVPFVPSAILVGDFYYLVTDAGVATCLDAHTGERVWQRRLPGAYTASPVATAHHIYFCSEAGDSIVIRANQKEYEQVARNRLGEPIFASPAISQGNLFIRTADKLFCVGE